MAITEHTNRPRILVAGCGALGGMIATNLSDSGEVFGLRRNPDAVPAGVTPVAADLMNPEQLAKQVPEKLDAIIYCLTPSSYDDAGYKNAYVTGLNNLLAATADSPVRRLIFISSTSVYHQNDDSWVDEDSPTRPGRFSGQRILEGERVALNSPAPATIVRLSGIYGPSRRRFLASVANGELDPATPAPFTNRIHEEDAAAAVAHLIERSLAGEDTADCYLVSDCEPARLDQVADWVRSRISSKPPAPGARTGGRAGSKRCNNQRLLDSGFRFRYPDYRSGYSKMISSTP